MIASPGKQLLQWVSDYIYPAEEAFIDEVYAREVAAVFCDALLRNGTTTPCVYCAVYPQSVDALFAEAEKRNMRLIAGKCMMDRNVLEALRDAAKIGYDQSKALIAMAWSRPLALCRHAALGGIEHASSARGRGRAVARASEAQSADPHRGESRRGRVHRYAVSGAEGLSRRL
jgi:cytosine/adenosine deaminase-related metal-dependent hydrolase